MGLVGECEFISSVESALLHRKWEVILELKRD
jgi:hypothetical protein